MRRSATPIQILFILFIVYYLVSTSLAAVSVITYLPLFEKDVWYKGVKFVAK